MNGDAEGNGFNPYPMRSVHSQSKIDVLTDDSGNKYFAMTNRFDSYSSVEFNVDPNCADQGVVYEASVRIRLHSEFNEKYFVYLYARRPSGSWFTRTILECPAQRYLDGFVHCVGEFSIDRELSEATEMRWRLAISDSRTKKFNIDFDDISIRYKRGLVDRFTVSANDASCWGEGSEIHVGTSTYYSWNNEVPNGFTSVIFNNTNNGDGTITFQLKNPPHIPVVSAEDSPQMAAQVALLSRNMKIFGHFDEDNKGKILCFSSIRLLTQIISSHF
jgi:hypothetical protein